MQSMSSQPVITLNNGIEMPALGLGVLDRDTRELTAGAVDAAIKTGYRLIDTAQSYLNEQNVGEAIARSGVPRSEIFVTTKLWLSKYGYDNALRAFDASLRRLELEYLDLFMLHWPLPSDFEATVQSWKAAEKLLAEGRTRAIGVANFTPTYLKQLADRTEVTPAVNQVEVHPLFTQKELCETNARLGIVTQAWSPIGGSVRKFGDPNKVSDPLTHPTIIGLANKYRKTPAQVVLRWHLEQGRSAIPKSFRSERIAENFNVFDFTLTDDDLAAIDALDTGKRSGANPETMSATGLNVTIED
jgi:diketogulonate reductase-like aldo/keto reductase